MADPKDGPMPGEDGELWAARPREKYGYETQPTPSQTSLPNQRNPIDGQDLVAPNASDVPVLAPTTSNIPQAATQTLQTSQVTSSTGVTQKSPADTFETLVSKFIEATGQSSTVAKQYLRYADNNLVNAVKLLGGFPEYIAQRTPSTQGLAPHSTNSAPDMNVGPNGDISGIPSQDAEGFVPHSTDSAPDMNVEPNGDISSIPSQDAQPVQAGVKRARGGEGAISKQLSKSNTTILQYYTPLNQDNDESAPEEVATKKRKTAKGKAIATSAKPKVSKANKPHKKDLLEKDDAGVNYGALEEEDVRKAYKPLAEEKLANRERNFKPAPGPAVDTIPIRTVDEMFADMGSKAELRGLFRILSNLSNNLKVATLCSGTDSPILGLDMIFAWFHQTHGLHYKLDHAMSAELVPQKQRFIMRNFKPEIILRDVMDLLRCDFGKALTVYGKEADVPTDIDVVISGWACVDFSNLNSNKKTLDDGGESGDTFNATRTYTNTTRPKLLIMENVSGAPWQHANLKNQAKNVGRRGIDKQMEEIGYAIAFLKLDTKDYYIPHTRVRGYMVCTDIQAWYNLHHGTNYPKQTWAKWLEEVATHLKYGMKELELQVKELRDILSTYSDRWVDLVKFFRSPANVPVEQMLIDEDSYLLDSLRIDKREKSRKPTAWKACQIGHEKYRDDLGVGRKRPLTDWMRGGGFNLPDNFDPQPALVERTLDTLDIAHMRSAQRGYDDREYCRMLELSQNVYRVEDMTQNGIVGCLMPSGYSWSTLRGRRINGIEAMRLQGLPVEKLDLAGLTQADLQDLAGNAMTSTVVCAVTLAALITFEEIFKKKAATETEDEGKPTGTEGSLLHGAQREDNRGSASTEDLLSYNSKNAAEYVPTSVSHVIEVAAKTVQLCSGYCTKDNKTYYRCKSCGHTACKSHFGKPKHDYEPFQTTRIDSNAFVAMIKNTLPRMWMFKINDGGDDWLSLLDSYLVAQERDYDITAIDLIKLDIIVALRSPLWLQNTKRVRRTWVVKYESQVAILVCTISETSAEWLFFLNGTKKPWNDELGQQMRNFPILRMKPTGTDLTQGRWEFWLPHNSEVAATVTSGGSLVDSYRKRVGIKRFNRDLVSTEVTIKLDSHNDRIFFESNVEGLYRLHQECGQAFDTLHVLEGGSGPKVFLFLDHEFREGDPKNHPYVITFDTAKLECREPRQNVLGRLKNPYETEKTNETPYWRQPISLASEEVREGSISKTITQQLKIEIKGRWSDALGISLHNACNQVIDYGHLPRNFSLGPQLSCTRSQTVFHARTQLPAGFDPSWIMEQELEVTNTAAPDLLVKLKWIVDRALENANHSVSVDQWMDVTTADRVFCTTCSPTQPSYHWTVRKIKGQAKLKIAPVEDWQETSEYELRIKNRPTGLKGKIQVQRTGNVKIKIEMNPTTLMHQAKSLLAQFGGSEDIKTSWRIISNDVQSKSLKLAPLILPDVAAGDVSYDLSTNAKNYLKVELFACQLRALKWVIQRENKPEKFVEEEIVEERVAQFGHTGWGKAEREIARRGCLAAFDVGFGKTILTLALMAEQRQVDEQWAQTSVDGAIPIKATMVFVPTQLTLQWKAEVIKHTHFKEENVLCIGSIATLKSLTIQHFIDADIIIVSDRIYGWNTYKNRVANFSGTLASALAISDASPRAWRAWHQSAVSNIRDFVAKLLDNPADLPDDIAGTYNHNLTIGCTLQTLIPSQRYKGQKYNDAKDAAAKLADEEQRAAVWRSSHSVAYLKGARKTGKKQGKKKPHKNQTALDVNGEAVQEESTEAEDHVDNKSSKKLEVVELGGVQAVLNGFSYNDMFALNTLGGVDGWKKLQGPVLEMFAPARMVVDEYHYHKETSLMFSLFLAIGEKANTRLLLSATPKLGSFSDIKTMAKLLQVNLGADDYRSMPNDLYAVKTTDMTAREKLMTSGQRLSNVLLERRHRHSQNFLNVFSGKGDAPPIQNERIDMLLPVRLPAVEFFEYNMMQQEIDNYQMETLQENQDPVSELQQAVNIPAYKNCKEAYEENNVALANTEKQLFVELTKAVHLQKLCNEDWDDVPIDDWGKDEWLNRCNDWIRMALTGTLEDPDCDLKITTAIEMARGYVGDNIYSTAALFGDKVGMLSGKKKSAQHGHLPERVSALSDIVANLNDVRRDLIDQIRLDRVSQTVLRVHSNDALDCNGCDKQVQSQNLEVLGKCGHIYCAECFALVVKENQCIVDGCFATANPYQLMSGSDLVRKSPEAPEGGKSAAIVGLIQKITENDEKVIVFAQDLQALNFLGENLKKQGIKYIDLHRKKDDHKAKALISFADGNKTTTVLLLNIGDASAAGSNLTIANHIIFMSPYHIEGSDGQREYDAAMKQAVGRALRMGQKVDRPVRVYQFFAKKTVDVDLLEHRNSMVLKGVGIEDNVEVAAFFDKSWGKGDYTSPCAEVLCRPDDEYA